MVSLHGRPSLVVSGIALAAVCWAAAPVAYAGPAQPLTPCFNGLTPFNPYVDNCGIPYRPPHAVGAAPDQTALLNCGVGSQLLRAICLSQYVNGGPGYYP